MSVLSSSRLDWYVRRAARMSPAEVAWRARDQAVQLAWSRRQVQPGQAPAASTRPGSARPAGARSFAAVLPPQAADAVPAAAAEAVLKAADRLMRGEWEVLGVARTDLVQPDWFADPVTGRRAPAGKYAFRINHRSQEQTGNIKQVWEISRLHHLTLLATAWYLTRDEAYAERVAAQLRSWWAGQPVPVRGALDQRHRDRHPPDQLRLDPPAAERLAAGHRAVRPQRAGRGADPLAPAVPGRVPQPRLVGQQPRDRRGRGPARRGLRVPLVPRERALAARGRAAAGAGTGPQHVPVRHRPGAGLGLSVLRGRARAGRGGRGAGGRASAERGHLAAPGRDDRQRRGPARPAAAAAPPG